MLKAHSSMVIPRKNYQLQLETKTEPAQLFPRKGCNSPDGSRILTKRKTVSPTAVSQKTLDGCFVLCMENHSHK